MEDADYQQNKDLIYSERHDFILNNRAKTEKTLIIYKSNSFSKDEKELAAAIKDPENPFYLYVMKLTKQDFEVLKQNQHLTAEFEDFGKHIVYLAQTCKSSHNFDFYIEDRNDGILFNIQEITPIRKLTHLSLQFKHGTQTEIRTQTMGAITTLKETVNSKIGRIEELTNIIALRDNEIERLKEDFSTEKQSYEAELRKLDIENKDIHLKDTSIISKQANEIENLKCVEGSLRDELHTSKEECKALQKEKTILQLRIKELYTKLDDKITKIQDMEQQENKINSILNNCQKDLIKARHEIQKLNQTIEFNAAEENKLKAELNRLGNYLEEENRKKQRLKSSFNSVYDELQSSRKLLNDTVAQNTKLTEDISQLKSKYEKVSMNLSLERSKQDQMEGNIKLLKTKVQELEKINKSNDKKMKDKNSEISKLKRKINAMQMVITELHPTDCTKTSNFNKTDDKENKRTSDIQDVNKSIDTYYFTKYLEGNNIKASRKEIPHEETPR